MLPASAMTTFSSQTNVSPRDPSAQNVQAGYTSLMAEGKPTGEAYYEVVAENEEVGYSPTTQAVNDVLYQEESQRMVNMLPEILLDPFLDEETKALAVEEATSSTRQENTMAYQYGRDKVTEPEDSDINAEYRDNRQASLDVMRSIVDYQLALDAAEDQTNMSANPSFVESAADFGQLMLPFWEATTVAEIQTKLGGSATDIAEAFVLMGESKQGLRDAFTAMPIEQRAQAAQSFVNAIMEANSNIFMTNELSARGMIDAVLYGDYSDTERWLDNIVSLSELSIVGKPVAWGASKVKSLAKARRVVSKVRNSSPLRVAQETNAAETRRLVNETLQDDTGEVANAVAGTDRAEAVMDAVAPEVGIGGSGLRNKVGNVTADYEKAIINNPDLAETVDRSAIGALTRKEIEAANARKVHRLQSVKGITSRNEMFTVESADTGAKIKGVYGPTEGGYTNAQEGIDLVSISLRNQGVGKDQLSVLKRDIDGEWKPVEGVPTEDGEYLIGLDYNYTTRFSDIVGHWEKFEVEWNFLDRAPLAAKAGVTRHLFDPALMLDPHIVAGANAGVDRAAYITKLMDRSAKDFTDGLKVMSDSERGGVLSYIDEANEKGLKFNEHMARAEYGFNDTQIEALKSFRSYWDDVWAIRNRTDAKAMADEGYLMLSDKASETRIYGRPKLPQHVDKNKAVFIPASDDLVRWKDIADDIEAGNGQIIEMRRPMDYDGVVTDYVYVSNSDNVRSVTQSDIVYPYREGYYEVNYTSPHFIIEKVTDGTREYSRAIATAETSEDAALYLERLARTEGLSPEQLKAKYGTRGNIKDRRELAGFEQDMYESYGHGNQRARGKRLEDATAVVRNTEQSNIQDPVQTMIDTSRKMGTRVAMTDYMNATKQRFMETYADVLPKKNGMTQFPARLEDIGDAANATSKQVADARTTFEYIAYLEHGYVNSMSEISKSALRTVADAVGARGFGRLEKLARWGAERSATDFAKQSAFQLYIALNPLRQALLNVHQSALLLANFPKYALNPRGLTADFTAMTDMAISGGRNLKTLAKATQRSEAELKLMWSEFEKSGLLDSIDLNNMVRGTLTEFAEGTKMSNNTAARVVGGAMRGSRKVGFDSGEFVNLTTAWLAQYDKAKQSKDILKLEDFHRIGADARSYTFNMNRAGDMPYNQNSFALLLQFFQVPHKAALQLGNRNLSKVDRARLGLYNAAAYGLPAGAMYSMFGDILPDPIEHPEMHDMAVQGLEFYMWNRMIQGMTGLDSDIDFSSMSPFDPYGVYEVMHAAFTTETGNLLAASPAGSLFFGNSPRITNFLKTAARFFNVTDDFEGDPTTMGHVFNDFAGMSSGWSNLMRAKMAYEYGKLYSARGEVVDPSVSTPEAIALAFGFPTMDAAREYYLNNKMYKTKEAARKDVDKWYNEYSARLSKEGITADEIDYQVKLMSQGMRMFADSPAAMERIQFKLERSIQRGDIGIYNAVLKLAGQLPPAEAAEMLRGLPHYNPQAQQQLNDVVESIRTYDENGDN